MLYGSFESKAGLPPLVLPENTPTFIEKFSPLNGAVSKTADAHMIGVALAGIKEKLISTASTDEMISCLRKCFDGSVGENFSKYVQFLDGSIYRGELLEGKKNGKGILECANGDKYSGDFVDDFFNGSGELTFSEKSKYEGAFKDGAMHGKGLLLYSGGDVYEGAFFEVCLSDLSCITTVRSVIVLRRDSARAKVR